MFERRRRARHQPAAEGQEGGPVVRRAAFDRQRADEFGLLVVRGPDDDALVAQIEQRLRALQRRVDIGDAGCCSSTFSAEVRARSRIRTMADSSAAPMTPTNTASCMTSTVLTDRPAVADGGVLGMRHGAEQRAGQRGAGQEQRRARARHERRPPCVAEPTVPESSWPPETACPARCGFSPGMSWSSPPPECKTALKRASSDPLRAGSVANHLTHNRLRESP